jgi:dipeptidyl aminopeptidase/acylaminoacyl peptidase
MTFPSWAPAAPDRLVAVSNEDGSLQAWAIDIASGERRRATDLPVGVEAAFITPDGSGVVWWYDATGDESGRWMVTPFEGGPAAPLLDGVRDGWDMGFSLAGGVVAVAGSESDAYRAYVSIDGEPARTIGASATPLGIGPEWESNGVGLSADGALLALRHTDRGDINHFGVRVVETRSGRVVGDLVDEGRRLEIAAWSPLAGDPRVALTHEREDRERPAIWNTATGARHDLPVALPGGVRVAGWWPDGGALLAIHELDGRSQLVRIDPVDGIAELVVDPGGVISGAGVRPDGAVWLRAESGARPPSILGLDGAEVVAPRGERAPHGRPYASLRFDGPDGRSIQAFVVEPDRPRPHPVVMAVHGGPDWAYLDEFDPWIQALVDHGYAVGMVNYRGSTGYGASFRDALLGDIGFPEVADTVAGLEVLAADGIVDPARAVIEGWSWGGYVTLLAVGIEPDRFVAGIAGIPVGDYVMCHEDCSPPQQAWDVATLGGTPQELPDLYRERSPITYVDRVRAPVLIIAGTNDSRCPIRQIRHYADALRAAGGRVESYEYAAGHHANVIDEQLRHAELELAFLATHLPVRGRNADADADAP